jgi:DNA modification methylase
MLVQANALHIPLPDQSVHMACFSPPYWKQRDYGVSGQLGLEDSPQKYIAVLMAAMAEVWRVLRDDGICFVNIDDCYMTDAKGPKGADKSTLAGGGDWQYRSSPPGFGTKRQPGLSRKSLALIPERFVIAASDVGWIVRAKPIWHKPGPMPSSAKDRPTHAYENIYMLTKKPRYSSDFHAVRQSSKASSDMSFGRNVKMRLPLPGQRAVQHRSERKHGGNFSHRLVEAQPEHGAPALERGDYSAGKNIRDVWTITAKGYDGPRYAAYPEKLVARMVKAGTSEKGCCPECGGQWERIVEASGGAIGQGWNDHNEDDVLGQRVIDRRAKGGHGYKRETIGWQPPCDHGHEPVPCIVLDPFVGSGTTVKVARELGRRGIGLDLSMPYLRLAQKRNRQMTLWEATDGTP